MRRIWPLLLLFLLAGCHSRTPAEPRDYPVSLRSAGGLTLEDVQISVWEEDRLVDTKTTDQQGQVCFRLPEGNYDLTLSGVPVGYDAGGRSPMSDTVILTSAPVPPEMGSPTSLGVGDVMYDFTLTTATGERVTLSQVLREKEVVLLDFWYSTCRPCAAAFATMEVVYSSARDEMEVIAVDPLEDAATVAGYQRHSFPMAACPSSWVEIFGVTMYPTTFVIDRYGMICQVHRGAITDTRQLRQLVEPYLGEGYVQRVEHDLLSADPSGAAAG